MPSVERPRSFSTGSFLTQSSHHSSRPDRTGASVAHLSSGLRTSGSGLKPCWWVRGWAQILFHISYRQSGQPHPHTSHTQPTKHYQDRQHIFLMPKSGFENTISRFRPTSGLQNHGFSTECRIPPPPYLSPQRSQSPPLDCLSLRNLYETPCRPPAPYLC